MRFEKERIDNFKKYFKGFTIKVADNDKLLDKHGEQLVKYEDALKKFKTVKEGRALVRTIKRFCKRITDV